MNSGKTLRKKYFAFSMVLTYFSEDFDKMSLSEICKLMVKTIHNRAHSPSHNGEKPGRIASDFYKSKSW